MYIIYTLIINYICLHTYTGIYLFLRKTFNICIHYISNLKCQFIRLFLSPAPPQIFTFMYGIQCCVIFDRSQEKRKEKEEELSSLNRWTKVLRLNSVHFTPRIF